MKFCCRLDLARGPVFKNGLSNNFFAVQNLKMALKKANILQHTKSFFV